VIGAHDADFFEIVADLGHVPIEERREVIDEMAKFLWAKWYVLTNSVQPHRPA
jgi:hypothetical protein